MKHQERWATVGEWAKANAVAGVTITFSLSLSGAMLTLSGAVTGSTWLSGTVPAAETIGWLRKVYPEAWREER